MGFSLLYGCASLPQHQTAPPSWQAHQTQLNSIERWQLRASIAANSADDGWNARINWQHAPQGFELRIFGPLGQGAVRLEGDANNVRLHTNKGTQHARSPRELLQTHTDIDLPVEYLQYWARGLPAPQLEVQAQSFNEAGYLSQLQQAGWQIEYSRYQAVDGYTLPRKIRLENEKYLAKIALSSWRIAP